MFKLSLIKFEYNIRNKNRESRDGTHGRKWFEKVLILAFSAFVVTPLTIIYWAAAWDVMSVAIFPDDILLSCLLTGVVSKLFLLLFYLIQEYMQSAHDYFYKKSSHTSLSSSTKVLCALFAKFMRFTYGFILSFVYILQYRSYWDTYNEYTEDIDYKYFFGLSIVTIIAYRYMLDGNFSSYCKTVPFELSIDENFESYFLQGTFIKIKNKWIEKIANYFYFEWLEMLISIFVWKGIYDVVETGTVRLFESVQPNAEGGEYWISLIFTAVLSYGLFFLFTLFKDFIRFESDKVFKKFSHFFLDFVDFLAYWAMVGCWRVIWDYYDIFAYDSGYIEEEDQLLFFILSVVIVFLICSVLGITANLYGPAGSVEEEDNNEEKEDKIEIKNVKSYNSNGVTVVEKF